MNEQQRIEGQQVKSVDPSDRKSEKDYAKYFETTYQPPSLKDAKRRGKEDVKVHRGYDIPDDMVGIGKDKKFYIRTYD